MNKRRCTATTSTGRPCRTWAVWGTDPPRCVAHDGSGCLIGAPKNSKNAEKHGYDSSTERKRRCSRPNGNLTNIQDIISDLARRQLQLSHLIEAMLVNSDVDLDALGRFFGLHGQNASRLGRLLRDRRALSGDAADGIADAIAKALDELSTELGTEL